jgi:hypothetical protein
MLRWKRNRMPKVMVGAPNPDLSFAGNAGRTLLNAIHPEFCSRG